MIGNQKNEGLFKSMFQLTAEGVLVVNKDGIILMENPASKNLFGYNAGALLGEHIDVLIIEKHREELKNHLLNLDSITDCIHLDVFGIKEDKTQFNLEIRLNSTAINDKNACIAFLRDTSNHNKSLLKIKQTNKALLESNRKFDALINNVKGILFRCENDRDYTMHYISEDCLGITGYAFGDYKNKTITYGQLILEGDRNRVWEHIQNSIKQKESYDCEYRIQHKNGNIKYVWEKGEAICKNKNKVIALEGFIIDITAQKETEKQLGNNEAKTKVLLEAIPDIMFIQDRKGNCLDRYCNSPKKIFMPPEEFIGLNMKDVLPDHIYIKIKESHQNVKTSGNIQISDYRIQGRKIIGHNEAGVVLMNNHKLLTIFRDVIEKKAQEKELLIKDNAQASASNSIIIADAQNLDLPIIYCNAAFEKNTGFKKEEVYGENCDFLQDGDRGQTYLESIAIEKHNNKIVPEVNKKQLKLNAQKLEKKVQERTTEVMETVQELVADNLNIEDQILITKQAINEAIANKVLVSEVVRNFPKGFIAVMNKDLQLVLAEGEALEELGLKPLIFEGMTLDDVSVFAEDRKRRIKEDISKTLSGKHLSFEIDYNNRYFAVNTAPLFDENNQIIYALLVYNDISEQKEIEFNIQNALKKVKELNELKSRFVSMASHELRTPLSAIMTSAILIGKQNEPGKEVTREKYILQIEKNVNHLVTILNDFLSLSKLEEGKTEALKECFDIISLSKVLINENKVNLKTGQYIRFNSLKEHLFVNLDAKLVRHIITNLLSNASKYSEENTSIDFKIEAHDNKVLIQILDRGIGISEEEQKHLFDRFFRAKNANNIEGTGLGLNIAKHYTELMGGDIGCKSKLNLGTTFWIKLPIES